MASMDIFNSSAFSMTSLTGAVEKIAYKPQLLGQLGIFEPMPFDTQPLESFDRRCARARSSSTAATTSWC